MQNKVTEDNNNYDIHLGYISPGYGIRISFDKNNKIISVDGNIPYYVSNIVNIDKLKEFSQNLLTMIENIEKTEMKGI